MSVIILNFNGKQWIEKCIDSVLKQTMRANLEVIVCDNNSSDGSDQLAETLLQNETRAKFIQTGQNLGFCAGNNVGALSAQGEFLFFLNNDAWLEPECLEILVAETEKAGATAAAPAVLNWGDNLHQWVYVAGYDLFGLPSFELPPGKTEPLFMPPGCSYLIRRGVFHDLGEFDPHFFMYADEYDLSWRLWIAGYSAIVVPHCRLHHRGAPDVNPEGGERATQYQTSISKRYYTNRNCLLTILKCAQHILFLLLGLQICLLILESVIAYTITRNYDFIKKAYFQAVVDAVRCDSLGKSRMQIQRFRKRGDFSMLQFLRLRPNRWDELLKVPKFGLPKIKNR